MKRNIGITNVRLDLGMPHVEPASPIRRARPRRIELESKSERRVGILAHSLYRDMKAQGFVTREIVGLASALLGELISDFKDAQELRLGVQVALGGGSNERDGDGCHDV